MIHLTPQQLSSYMDGELNEVSTELVRRHMGLCEECTLKFAALEVQEEQLSHALVHDPGDEFFDRFADQVERLLPGKEPGSKRGLSSPASRAAAIREAAREAARVPATSAPFAASGPDPEQSADAARRTPKEEPAAARPAAPRSAETRAAAMPPAADDFDLDGEEAIAALTAERPSSGEPPSIPGPSPAGPRVPDAAPPSFERNAPPPTRPTRPARPARPAQRPAQRRPKIRRPAPSIPWYAAVILAAIAGAAGLVVSRTDPVSAWLDAHGLRSSQHPPARDAGPPAPSPEPGTPARGALETPPESGAPAGDRTSSNDVAPPPGDSEASAQDDFEPEPQAAEGFLTPAPSGGSAPGGGRDPYAGLPSMSLAQVRAAQRSKDAADARPSAARYEAAADEWERAIPLLRGAQQQSLGRLELASSRYRAWENEPTESRAASAAASIRIYLALAPQGAPRDMAKEWLARVNR